LLEPRTTTPEFVSLELTHLARHGRACHGHPRLGHTGRLDARMTECVILSGTRIGFTASLVSERRHSGLARLAALGADPFARAPDDAGNGFVTQ
jgi:hypothetical protein